ncbi:MAG: metallophosphoesterase [Candidatus Thorarchaeota archaeon]
MPSSITTPGTINGKIVYPRQHIPAIILNGSQVELQIKAPDNITSWEISLNREYRAYTLSHDPPVYNISANLWRLNVTIASSTIRDLYDLNVTISDGLNSQVLIEWNAVQVRYEYPTNPLIYHLSDVHIGQGLQDQTRSILSSLYQAAMAEADLIIITGDITDTGFSTHFLEFKNLFRNSRVPIIVSAGNHDRDFSDTYSVYISHFGADYYTFNLGPDIFIVMANSHHSPYEYNATQIGWVERDFAASDAKLKIMAGHAPLMNPEFFTYWLVQWEREELQRIFDTYNVSVYLSGHFHGDLVNIINDTYWIQTAPCGGNPRMYDPYGHKTRGLRALNFTNYALTSWSWMDLNWSQSIDALYLSRDPLRLIDADIGGYLSITNTLGYTARNLMVDILVEPLTGPEVYRASGATVLETVNGTNTWLIRFSLDIPNGETGVIRVYTSNAQAPVITAVEYPPSAPLQTLVFIYANVSNPYSGIHFVSINLSIAGNPYFQPVMSQAGFERYRYYLPVTLPGVYNFAITAFDYAGYNITTSFYSFTVTQQAPSAPVLLPLNAVSETGNFTVIWTQSIDSDGSIDHYTLQMSNSIDFSVVLDEQNISALNYAVLGLVNGSYYFRVCGVDNFGAHSSWSNVESISVEIPGVTPPPPPPPPPPPIPIELVIAIVGGVAVVVIVIIVVYALIRRGRGKTQ